MAEAMEVEETYLDPKHHDVSILALRMSSRRHLGLYLNLQAAQPLPCGLLPDFNGLAECIGFEYIEICNFGRDRDPTNCLLNEWGNKPEMGPTLGNLVKFLLQMERVDVLEDCKESIKRDAEHYLERKKGSLSVNPVQDQTVSQSPFDINDMSVDETHIMTIQDVEAGGPTYYDAFVCYNPEAEDLKFVKRMIEELENKRRPNNLKLFVPNRDDLPGASKHVISAKLIQERCKRMVIVMSPRYLQSDACDFQTKFAHALSPGSRSKKLVPVLISRCETPNILRHVTMCDYTRGDLTGWFWERLYRSLQAPLNPHEITIQNPGCLTDLQMKLVAQSQQFSLQPSSSSSSVSSSTSSQQRPAHRPTPSSSVLPPSVSGSPNLSSSPRQAAKATAAASAAASNTKSSLTQAQLHSLDSASVSSDVGRASPFRQPEELPASASGLASGFQETSFSSSAPPSPNPSRKDSGKKKGKKKMLMNKMSALFSSHTHHASDC